jgi:hypothetical protein
MIEFIIPLNLLVRAVEVTAGTESPSPRLLQEMVRWARHQPKSSPGGAGLPNQLKPMKGSLALADSENRSTRTEIEQELEQLRAERNRLAGAIGELGKVSKQFEKQMDGLIREFQVATVELAQAIAAKLVFENVDNDRYPIANLVHEVVSRLDSAAGAVVRLHPDDLALVHELPSINDSNHESSLKLVPDSTLARGDCKAKAGEITVIYELRRQLDDIRRQLLSTVGGNAET